MKLCAFKKDGTPRLGVVTDHGIIDITQSSQCTAMNDLISGWSELEPKIQQSLKMPDAETFEADSVEFLNVTAPEKIICIGLNYKSHAEETGGEPPKHIVFFSKFSDALTPAEKAVTLPSWLRCFDHEAELVIVIGKPAYNISIAEAHEHIFGYTCGNDLSARDSQFLSTQWLAGKAIPGFAPNGPHIVTRDEFNPEDPHGVFCKVNGKTAQAGDTSDMIFSCTEIVAEASRYFKLNTGDLIYTGTPSGVIMGNPKGERVWLKPGDYVEVTIEGIGTLRTPLV